MRTGRRSQQGQSGLDEYKGRNDDRNAYAVEPVPALELFFPVAGMVFRCPGCRSLVERDEERALSGGDDQIVFVLDVDGVATCSTKSTSATAAGQPESSRGSAVAKVNASDRVIRASLSTARTGDSLSRERTVVRTS